MGDYDNGPLIAEADFAPEAEVFSIWVSQKSRKGTKNGQPVTIQYWEGCWDIPVLARAEEDTRKRPQITASSPESAADAEAKCRQKVLQFWLGRADGVRERRPESLTREQKRAGYTVRTFMEEYFKSKTNPDARSTVNRWAPNNERKNRGILNTWINPYLGDYLLTEITHEIVRIHFTETLPSVLDENDQRRLGDKWIRTIYSLFRAGMNRAGAKSLIQAGEYLDIGLQMSFEPAGTSTEIDDLMWKMNSLMNRPEVIEDPLALRWALAFGQALRRGERCGLRFSDINWDENKITVRRQMNYIPYRGDFLDERLKANEARKIDITDITRPFLLAAKKRRELLIASKEWKPKNPDMADLVLLRDDGNPEKLNHDNALFHEFMAKYEIEYQNLSPGSLRQACATYWANYGGVESRGVPREYLRKFLGHSTKSNMDAYYARTSDEAMSREFSGAVLERPTRRSRALTHDN
jgi:integrase